MYALFESERPFHEMLDMFDLLDINSYVKTLNRVSPSGLSADAYIMDLTIFEEDILGLDLLTDSRYITITRCNQHYVTLVDASGNRPDRGLGRSIAAQASALSTVYKDQTYWYDNTQAMYFVIKPMKGVTNAGPF